MHNFKDKMIEMKHKNDKKFETLNFAISKLKKEVQEVSEDRESNHPAAMNGSYLNSLEILHTSSKMKNAPIKAAHQVEIIHRKKGNNSTLQQQRPSINHELNPVISPRNIYIREARKPVQKQNSLDIAPRVNSPVNRYRVMKPRDNS